MKDMMHKGSWLELNTNNTRLRSVPSKLTRSTSTPAFRPAALLGQKRVSSTSVCVTPTLLNYIPHKNETCLRGNKWEQRRDQGLSEWVIKVQMLNDKCVYVHIHRPTYTRISTYGYFFYHIALYSCLFLFCIIIYK